ncbi:MAG: LPS export ABC transporter periplasmic protein LptC [Cyanobacteria bacterium P01_A01_bin.3]
MIVPQRSSSQLSGLTPRSAEDWLKASTAGLALAALLVSCGGGSTSGSNNSQASEPSEDGDDSSLVYENLTLTETNEEGDLLWELNAATARYGDGGESAQLSDVSGVIYDEAGQQIFIEAKAGIVLPGEQRMELEDEVTADAPHLNLDLSSERAVWLPEDNTLTAVGSVIITERENDIELTGDRLMADLSANIISLANDDDEEPLLAVSSDPPLELSMLEVEWDLADEVVTARGNIDVYHQGESVRLQGETLSLDIPTNLLTITGSVYALSETDGAQLWTDRAEWVIGSDVTQAFGNVRYVQPDQDLNVVGSTGQANWVTKTFSVTGGSTLTQLTLPDDE